MKYEEQFSDWSKEQLIEELVRQHRNLSHKETKVDKLEQQIDYLTEKISKAELIEQNFAEQLEIQVAVKTKEIVDGYLEFVKTIKDLLVALKK